MWLYGDNSCRICGKELAEMGPGVISDYCESCLDDIDEGLLPAALLMEAIKLKYRAENGAQELAPSALVTQQGDSAPNAGAPAKADSISAEQPESSKEPKFWRLNWQPKQA